MTTEEIETPTSNTVRPDQSPRAEELDLPATSTIVYHLLHCHIVSSAYSPTIITPAPNCCQSYAAKGLEVVPQ